MSKYRIVCRYESGDGWYYAQFKLFGLLWINFHPFQFYDYFDGQSKSLFPKKVEAFIENKINSPKVDPPKQNWVYKTYG